MNSNVRFSEHVATMKRKDSELEWDGLFWTPLNYWYNYGETYAYKDLELVLKLNCSPWTQTQTQISNKPWKGPFCLTSGHLISNQIRNSLEIGINVNCLNLMHYIYLKIFKFLASSIQIDWIFYVTQFYWFSDCFHQVTRISKHERIVTIRR